MRGEKVQKQLKGKSDRGKNNGENAHGKGAKNTQGERRKEYSGKLNQVGRLRRSIREEERQLTYIEQCREVARVNKLHRH